MTPRLRPTLGLLPFVLFVSGHATAANEPRKPVASYALDLRLDDERHVLGGRGTITWTNTSRRAVRELYFHTYLNAFEPGSLFLRGSRPGGRSGGLVGRGGQVAVTRLVAPELSDEDLWPGAEAHSPGDANDRTDILVPLPDAVEPGETIELDIEFESTLPEVVERTGFSRDFHFLGQFFPKLARLEPDGSWAHFPFHPYGEFYADFGDYDVTLDVPEDHLVGATGRLALEGVEGGRARYSARLEGAIDFAFTTWPGYVAEAFEVGGVEVELLSPRGSRSRAAHRETIERALPFFSKLLVPYPYPTLTVVEPPRHASRAGGMEYPSLFTTVRTDVLTLARVRVAELTTAHELGHQWFQGLLASNEQEHPFLDEGLTSYIEWRYLDEEYGAGSVVDWPGLRVSRLATGRLGGLFPGVASRPLALAARDFPDFSSLSAHVYGKTALTLETLARVYGRDRLEGALGAYAREQAGRHPKPEDLYRALERGLGEGARGLVRELFESATSVDLRLLAVDQSNAGHSEPGRHRTTVQVTRLGPAFPFEVRFEFSDGSHLDRSVTGPGKQHVVVARHDAALRRVVVDPHTRIVLDQNLDNNRRSFEAEGTSARALLGLVLQSLVRSLSP